MRTTFLLALLLLGLTPAAKAELLYGAASRVQGAAATVQINRAIQLDQTAVRTRERAAILRGAGAGRRADFLDRVADGLEQRRNGQIVNAINNIDASAQNRAIANALGSTSSAPAITTNALVVVKQAASVPMVTPVGIISPAQLLEARGYGLVLPVK